MTSVGRDGEQQRSFTGHEEDDDLGLVNAKGRMFDPRLARFTTTDPVIADIWDGQSLNRYAYVNGNPLAFTDPTGFVKEELEPGQTETHSEPSPASVSHLVLSDNVVPAPQENMAPSIKQEAASVGAHAPPVDVNTTGNGAESLPQETPRTEPIPARPGFWGGIWDGVVDLHDHLDELVPGSWANMVANLRTVVEIYQAYKQGDVIDAINVVNPMMSVARVGFAVDDDDWYTAGQQAVGVGVAILSVVIAKKAVGIKKGSGASKSQLGRGRKQERLRQLGQDPNVSSADRGWIRQEQNAVARRKRETIRVPPGKELAHTRGREAAKGYDHIDSPSNLQDAALHRVQHSVDNFGQVNKERP